jgi:hypothetical protein
MNQGIKINLISIIIFLSSAVLFSQPLSKKQFIKAVQDADNFFYYDEDYDKAALEYEYFLTIYPENSNPSARNISGKIVYTIQLKAARTQINMKEFEGVAGIREIYSEDDYYRYVTGEFSSFRKAKTALAPLQESKYKDAFIRELNYLLKK